MIAIIPFITPVNQIKLAPGSTVTIANISWQEFDLNRKDQKIFCQVYSK